MPLIKLQSSDGEIFPIDVSIAKLSTTIRDMLEHLGMDELENDSDNLLPLPNIEGNVLKKVIEWAENHKTEKSPKVIETDKIYWYPLSPFNQNFIDTMELKMVFDVILAANYLDIEDLLSLGTKAIADRIKKCKDAEEIRQVFNVQNDFTEEELEQVKKENEWAQEK